VPEPSAVVVVGMAIEKLKAQIIRYWSYSIGTDCSMKLDNSFY